MSDGVSTEGFLPLRPSRSALEDVLESSLVCFERDASLCERIRSQLSQSSYFLTLAELCVLTISSVGNSSMHLMVAECMPRWLTDATSLQIMLTH